MPVLATGSLGDFVLTLAEEPALFLPQWSEEILREVRRTQFEKLGWPEHLADFWQKQCRECFPEAMVEDYERSAEYARNHFVAGREHRTVSVESDFSQCDN